MSKKAKKGRKPAYRMFVDYSGRIGGQAPHAWGGVLLRPGKAEVYTGGRLELPDPVAGMNGEHAAQLAAQRWLDERHIQAVRCCDDLASALRSGAEHVPATAGKRGTRIAHAVANAWRLEPQGAEEMAQAGPGLTENSPVTEPTEAAWEELPMFLRLMLSGDGEEPVILTAIAAIDDLVEAREEAGEIGRAAASELRRLEGLSEAQLRYDMQHAFIGRLLGEPQASDHPGMAGLRASLSHEWREELEHRAEILASEAHPDAFSLPARLQQAWREARARHTGRPDLDLFEPLSIALLGGMLPAGILEAMGERQAEAWRGAAEHDIRQSLRGYPQDEIEARVGALTDPAGLPIGPAGQRMVLVPPCCILSPSSALKAFIEGQGELESGFAASVEGTPLAALCAPLSLMEGPGLWWEIGNAEFDFGPEPDLTPLPRCLNASDYGRVTLDPALNRQVIERIRSWAANPEGHSSMDRIAEWRFGLKAGRLEQHP